MRPPAIGRPLANTRLYILDPDQNPVPVGVTGELHIAGIGLARGYLGRPELTAERFLPDPFHGPGERMYRTGDLARHRADGTIEYLGRTDNQIKIRGHRIELGEVEAALTELPLVRAAAVTVTNDRLIAHLVPAAQPLDIGLVRDALEAVLPTYMLPAQYVVLDTLPLNSSGKIDHHALPTPTADTERPLHAPGTPTEIRLAALWSDLLGMEQVGAHDDFFRLGGHSLLAVPLMARIGEVFGVRLSLSQVFRSPTLSALARDIDSGAGTPALLVRMRTGGSHPPVFLLHPAGGTVFCYRTLVGHLDTDRTVYALQSPEIAGLGPASSDIDQLCGQYASAIEEACPSGRLSLAGWSLGGVLALRVTELLEKAGRQVTSVGVFDTILPTPEEGDMTFEDFLSWALERLHAEAIGLHGTLAAAHEHARRYAREHGIHRLAEQIRLWQPETLAEEHALSVDCVDFLQSQHHIQLTHARLLRGFTPGRVHAPLHVIWAEQTTRREDWLAHTAQPHRSTHTVLPGDHETLITREANARAIAALLSS